MTRVLIVDDKAENLYLLRALLVGNQMQVDEARHGAEALEKARSTPPDLIISDLLMPVMDGYTLLRHWKSDERLKTIPFIVYTATYTEPKDERLALDLGADAFILKPAEPRALMACFKEVLAKAQSRELPQARSPSADEKALQDNYGEVIGRKLEQNINERKFAEAEARHLATFPKYNPNPVLEFSSDGRLTYSNRAAKRMAEACEGSDLASLLPGDTRRIASECLTGGHPREHVETRRGARTLSWSFYPINELQVVHCYAEDITERLQLEERFRQSQKMDAIGHLAAGVAHDFNNLLTVVQFEVVQLAESKELTSELREAVDQIGRAAERAANLTRQLLTFSRKQSKEVQLLDLRELVTGMTRMFERILGADIKLELTTSASLPRLYADPGMIEQVIMNLVVNSRDAMPQGGRIEIAVSEVAIATSELLQHPEGRPGRFLQLSVTDTGTGIAPENLPRIFEPFFTTKSVGKGTGLGLATVFGIVNQHEGWIEVASEPGRGTTFRIILPEAPEAGADEAQAVSQVQVQGGSETILLVEDDETIRGLVEAGLERYGYRVLVFGNGPEAVAKLEERETPVDLLVTDLILPGGLSGGDIVRRAQELRPGLKSICISGYASEDSSRDLHLEAGVNLLRKPFVLQALVQLVRQRLDEPKQ
jgi:two-component system, cell cycle sensor histidine kinase and response regulator CckA